MNGRYRKQRTSCPGDLIADVDASDLARARAAVARGIQAAENEWIPSHVIASALALELQNCIAGNQPSTEVATYLRKLADVISKDEWTVDCH